MCCLICLLTVSVLLNLLFEYLSLYFSNVEAMLSNKSEVDAFLGAYPRDRFANWVALASHITPDTVERLQPSGGWIYSCAQFQSEKSDSKDRVGLPIPSRLKRGNEADVVCPPESIDKGEELLPVLKTAPETDVSLLCKE